MTELERVGNTKLVASKSMSLSSRTELMSGITEFIGKYSVILVRSCLALKYKKSSKKKPIESTKVNQPPEMILPMLDTKKIISILMKMKKMVLNTTRNFG